MTFALSLLGFLLLLGLFVAVCVRSTAGRFVVTPLLLFGCFEIVCVWPSTLLTQLSGQSATGAFPALIAALGFAALLVGFVVMLALIRCSTEQPGRFRDSRILWDPPESAYGLAIVLIACVLSLLGFYLYQGVPPFIEGLLTLGAGPDAIESAINIVANGRELVTKGHYLGGSYRGQGVVLELMQDGWPFLVALAFVLFLVTRRARWLVSAFVLAALMLFFIAGSGQRWQVVAAVLYLGLVASLVTPIRLRWVLSIVGVTALMYVGMSMLNSNYEDLGQADDPVSTFATRASARLLGNGLHNIEGINFVEDGSLQLGMGSIHFQKFFTSIPGVGKDETPFSVRLALLLDPYRSVDDSTYASQTYFGWLYDDFGLPGVVVVYFVLGVVLACAEGWVFTRSKTLVDVPALAFVIFYLGDISLDGPATVSASFVIVTVVWLSLRACVAAGRSRWRRFNVTPATASALSAIVPVSRGGRA